MKKKIIGLIFSIVMLTILVAPVMAKPSPKVAVTAIQPTGATAGGVRWLAGDNILQIRDGIGGGTVALDIPEIGILTGITSGTLNIKMKFSEDLSSPEPPYPMASLVRIVVVNKMVWVFDDSNVKTGTFEGIMHNKVTRLPSPTREAHCVLQGTGDFEGQTLVLSSVNPSGAFEWAGFIVMPK